MKILIPSDYMEQGCFTVPRVIFSKDIALSPYEKHLLTTLMAVEDEYLPTTEVGWFFISNKGLRERCGISLKAIPSVRKRLHDKGLLDFRQGFTGHPTEYLILLDHFYRAPIGRETSTPLKASS